MGYGASEPLKRWRGARADTIAVLASGHAGIGKVTGPGRPLNVSKPLAHAYVITMLSEFQGFVRDLHDLSVARVVSESAAGDAFVPVLVDGMTSGRGIDRGNATHSTIKSDFARLGLSPLDIATHNKRWSGRTGDAAKLDQLVALRNVLGHGNDSGLRMLLAGKEVQDTISWARGQLPVLNRYARALDRVAWDHLLKLTGKEPWT